MGCWKVKWGTGAGLDKRGVWGCRGGGGGGVGLVCMGSNKEGWGC